MARIKPAPSANGDGYTGMLITACVAMTIGVLALLIEASEYGWEQKAPATPKANIPAMPKGLASVDLPSPLQYVDTTKPEEKAPVVTAPVAPAPGQPATTAPAVPADAPDVASKPAETPVTPGPIPSPLLIPGRVISPVTPAASPATNEPETKQPAPSGPIPSPIQIRPRSR